MRTIIFIITILGSKLYAQTSFVPPNPILGLYHHEEQKLFMREPCTDFSGNWQLKECRISYSDGIQETQHQGGVVE